MSDVIHFELTGELARFAKRRASPDGVYQSVDEYVRDLVRRDWERWGEDPQLDGIWDELKTAAEADDSEYRPIDVEAFVDRMKHDAVRHAR
ncbi:MAG: addiction module antitoxin [Puniceicoccales bacterium]